MSTDFEKHSFGFLVYDIARLLREQFNTRASTLDLTQAQGRALVHLKRNEGVNQTTLANLLDVQPITLVRQLDKLEEKGLIERRPDEHDRRMQRLFLTPIAESLIEQLVSMGRTMTDDAFAGISEAARSEVMSSLQLVKENLARGVDAAGGSQCPKPDA